MMVLIETETCRSNCLIF